MLRQMDSYRQLNISVDAGQVTAIKTCYDTRRKRRMHVGSIIHLLEAIRQHEEAYLSRIPENLQSGQPYEDAELTIDTLDQAIDLLKDAY